MITNGLMALTVPEERHEIKAVLQPKPRRIKFAFFQPMLDGSKLPFWHVDWKNNNDFGTTLSMEGLRDWGILK